MELLTTMWKDVKGYRWIIIVYSQASTDIYTETQAIMIMTGRQANIHRCSDNLGYNTRKQPYDINQYYKKVRSPDRVNS